MLRNAVIKISFLTAFLLLVSPLPRTQNAQTLRTTAAVAPVPAWVKSEPLSLATSEQAADAREGVIRLLSDQQVRVVGNTTERYFHNAEQIMGQPGIEHASQLQLEFDPTFQHLVIHRIQILRGQQTINALRPREIKFVQQESELEEQLFNGTLAALVILNDVRVGDVVEYDYSVNGENPILGGKFADVSYLVESEPVSKLRYRLLWPSARPLKYALRGLDLTPQVTAQGNITEYVWERANTAAPNLLADANARESDYPILHLSEFQSWQEVVAWALPLYRTRTPSPQLRQQIETWRQLSPEPEKRLLAALRFVQDEIRYLGIEMGRHSHLPHDPSLVLSRRYGDCKDKALLLCTALNALGINAEPALVNTELYEQVEELPPSPYAFDHVIIRAQLDGKTYWFDATTSLQRGNLAQHVNPNFGRGLPVKTDVNGLAEISVNPARAPFKTVKEIFRLSENNTAVLEVTTTWRGPEADEMRTYLAANSLKTLSQERLRVYTETDRSLTPEGSPQVHDDASKNEIVYIERFRIGRFWKENKRLLVADRIRPELPWIDLNHTEPNANKRIRIHFPLDVEHLIEVHGAALPEGQDRIEHEALSLHWRRVQLGDVTRLSYRLRTLRPFVSARDARSLNEAIEKMEDATKVSLSSTGRLTNSLNQQARVFGLVGLLLMPILAWLAVRWLQFRQRGKVVTPAVTEALAPPGATPATALPANEMPTMLQYMLCLCGANYPLRNWPQVTMLYDGKRIRALQLRCDHCQQLRDLHFELPAAQEAAPQAALPREERA